MNERLDENAEKVLATVKNLLGESYTTDEFIQALIFQAAFARVLVEDGRELCDAQARALDNAGRVMTELKALNAELLAAFKQSGAESANARREQAERADAVMSQFLDVIRAARPLVEKGDVYETQQQGAGFLRWKEQQENHKQWKRWQAEEKAANPKFGFSSKIEQARRLKERHSIPDKAETIAKRLV